MYHDDDEDNGDKKGEDNNVDVNGAEIAIKKVKIIMLMMMITVITMTKNKKSPLTISSSLMS